MSEKQSPQAQTFIDYLYAHMTRFILSWDDAAVSDIYVVWIGLSLYQDDCCQVEFTSIGYGTNAHTTPELEKSYGSQWSPGCWAGGTHMRLCHDLDSTGRSLRNAYLDEVVTRFDRSDRESADISEHSVLQYKRNHSPAEFSPEQKARLEELNQRFGVTEAERQILEEESRYLLIVYQNAMLNPVLNACMVVIQRLHVEAVLKRKCGFAVPVGIAFSNDIYPQGVLQATRDANPHGISRGLEEWIMGCTYEQIEAAQELMRDVTAKTPHEQATFFAKAALAYAERLYLNKRTPLSERLNALGSQRSMAMSVKHSAPEVITDFVSLLITGVEERASAHPVTDHSYRDANNVAMCLLSAIESVGRIPRLRGVVRNEDVTRLHQLLARLFREGESLERVGLTTTLIARTLHALRPNQFPADKFGGGGETANRLLNYRAFGLVKSDPTTSDYDEVAEKARIAARRQARQRNVM